MGRLKVRAQPGARKNRIVGRLGDAWKLAVSAPPADGKANEALVKGLAGWLGAPASAVTLRQGRTARMKVFEVEGLTDAEIDERLAARLEEDA